MTVETSLGGAEHGSVETGAAVACTAPDAVDTSTPSINEQIVDLMFTPDTAPDTGIIDGPNFRNGVALGPWPCSAYAVSTIAWKAGYSHNELGRAQERFGLTFPPDLVALLQDRQPIGGPDWNSEGSIRPLLAWPFEGLLFDVEENELWWPEWGERPDEPELREEVLRSVVTRAPPLIPIFSHRRYLPSRPNQAGNPVFSLYQSDVIHYGVDLEDYFERERDGWDSRPWPASIKEIEFWSELVRRNGD